MINGIRVLIVVNVIVMLVQAMWAGRMLGGDARSVELHELTAKVLVLLGTAIALSMILARRVAKFPRSLLISSVGLVIAEILEFALGHMNLVAFHVPLGLAIFGGAVRQMVWVLQQRGGEPEKAAA